MHARERERAREGKRGRGSLQPLYCTTLAMLYLIMRLSLCKGAQPWACEYVRVRVRNTHRLMHRCCLLPTAY